MTPIGFMNEITLLNIGVEIPSFSHHFHCVLILTVSVHDVSHSGSIAVLVVSHHSARSSNEEHCRFQLLSTKSGEHAVAWVKS
jgi:hypothetical protein